MTTTNQNAFKELMADPAEMHKFFVHCRGLIAPENFCCYYLIEMFKRNPRKRMANFIIDNYMKSSEDKLDEFDIFTIQLNLTTEGGGKINENNVKTRATEMRASYAKIGSTLVEKTKRHGVFGAIRMKVKGTTKPASDLFDDLQKIVGDNLSDSYDKFKSNPIGQAKDGGMPLFKFIQAITTAGWSPKDLGIWN